MFSDAELLDLWERGSRCHPLDRALLMLAAAFPQTPAGQWADWPIGRRNQALAAVRCRCFGNGLGAWTSCPKCAEKLEFEMDAQLFIGDEPGESAENWVTACHRAFRLPTSRDLARVVNETNPATAAVRLAESCLMEKDPPVKWSEEELSEIGERLAAADPFAETLLSLHCPHCGNEWQGALDLASFFWTEIESRVRQILFCIHTLAGAYGWSEGEILALSESRRALYMEMAQS